VIVNGAFRRLAVVASVVGALGVLPACRSGASKVSSDPNQRIYRNPTADFGKLKGLTLHFVSVTTNNNEGVDLVKSAFVDSLKTHMASKFGEVSEGDSAPAGGAVLDVSVRVNWGSRAARAIVGYGAGRAGIEINYDLKDASGSLLAKLHVTDRMSGGFYGGNAKELAFAASSKWDRYFAETVLVNAAPTGS